MLDVCCHCRRGARGAGHHSWLLMFRLTADWQIDRSAWLAWPVWRVQTMQIWLADLPRDMISDKWHAWAIEAASVPGHGSSESVAVRRWHGIRPTESGVRCGSDPTRFHLPVWRAHWSHWTNCVLVFAFIVMCPNCLAASCGPCLALRHSDCRPCRSDWLTCHGTWSRTNGTLEPLKPPLSLGVGLQRALLSEGDMGSAPRKVEYGVDQIPQGSTYLCGALIEWVVYSCVHFLSCFLWPLRRVTTIEDHAGLIGWPAKGYDLGQMARLSHWSRLCPWAWVFRERCCPKVTWDPPHVKWSTVWIDPPGMSCEFCGTISLRWLLCLKP